MALGPSAPGLHQLTWSSAHYWTDRVPAPGAVPNHEMVAALQEVVDDVSAPEDAQRLARQLLEQAPVPRN